MDATPPSIIFSQLTATQQSTVIHLTFSISDLDSGITNPTLKVRVNGGAWSDIAGAAAGQNEMWYPGQFGKTYEFQVSAKDGAGNQAAASVSTQIEASCKPDYSETADNQVTGASLVTPGQPQEHNLCSTDDVDWFAFDVQAGKTYALAATSLSGGAAFRLELYGAGGSGLVASGFSANFGQSAAVFFKAPSTGRYTLKVQPIVPGLAGTQVKYRLTGSDTILYYFPIVGK